MITTLLLLLMSIAFFTSIYIIYKLNNKLDISKSEFVKKETDNKDTHDGIIAKLRDELNQLKIDVATKDQQIIAKNSDVEKEKTYTEKLLLEKKELENKHADLISDKDKKINELTAEIASKNEKIIHADGKIEAGKEELKELRKNLHDEFQNIANKIFADNAEKIRQQSTNSINEMLSPFQSNINTVIAPFHQQLESFRTTIEKVAKDDKSDRDVLTANIKSQIEHLNSTVEKIGTNANDLTNALKGNVKKLGNWGETVLNEILEYGLTSNRYTLQAKITDESGKNIINDKNNSMQPDATLLIPDGRIIIDSKIFLKNYQEYINATEKEQQDISMKLYIKDIRGAIDQLSDKEYTQHAIFVLMFIPIDAAYISVVGNDTGIVKYAYDKNIFLAGPTNLMLMVKLVDELWTIDTQSNNHQAIIKLAKDLYGAATRVSKRFDTLSEKIVATQKSYDEVKTALDGQQGVLTYAKKLEELGIKHPKLKIHNNGNLYEQSNESDITDTESQNISN